MVREVIEGLLTDADSRYLDGTLGGGGHTSAILSALSSHGRVIAMDRDPDAIARAKIRFADETRLSIHYFKFSKLDQVTEPNSLNGVLLDLGMSSDQLNDTDRGFSFMRGNGIDMRMNPTEGASAWDVIADQSQEALAAILKTLGEILSSNEAAEILKNEANSSRDKQKMVASLTALALRRHCSPNQYLAQVFQALRMWINDEEGEIKNTLPKAMQALKPGGRLAVITFHSLEDRWVKRYIQEGEKKCICPIEQWQCTCGGNCQTIRRLHKKALRPSASEIATNPRSRSAKLRIAEKIK